VIDRNDLNGCISIYRLTELIVGSGTPPTPRGPGWYPTNRNSKWCIPSPLYSI